MFYTQRKYMRENKNDQYEFKKQVNEYFIWIFCSYALCEMFVFHICESETIFSDSKYSD